MAAWCPVPVNNAAARPETDATAALLRHVC